MVFYRNIHTTSPMSSSAPTSSCRLTLFLGGILKIDVKKSDMKEVMTDAFDLWLNFLHSSRLEPYRDKGKWHEAENVGAKCPSGWLSWFMLSLIMMQYPAKWTAAADHYCGSVQWKVQSHNSWPAGLCVHVSSDIQNNITLFFTVCYEIQSLGFQFDIESTEHYRYTLQLSVRDN